MRKAPPCHDAIMNTKVSPHYPWWPQPPCVWASEMTPSGQHPVPALPFLHSAWPWRNDMRLNALIPWRNWRAFCSQHLFVNLYVCILWYSLCSIINQIFVIHELWYKLSVPFRCRKNEMCVYFHAFSNKFNMYLGLTHRGQVTHSKLCHHWFI